MLLLADLVSFSCDWIAVPLPLVPLVPLVLALALAPHFPGIEAHSCHIEVISSLVHSPLLLVVVVVAVHSPLLLGQLVQ